MREEIGKRLKQARASKGINQSTAASRVNVSLSVWSRWERGQSVPSIDHLTKIHIILGVSLGWLILGVDSVDPQQERLYCLVRQLPSREIVKWIELLEVRLSGKVKEGRSVF